MGSFTNHKGVLLLGMPGITLDQDVFLMGQMFCMLDCWMGLIELTEFHSRN